ncbi:hypothetical protein [Methylobacterium sp. J-092]|uniref:hypothetical protein n=1 Tax=Methylobacterium sp. J-092 TaxID=2836667 RepID=UPI001FBAB203|nr:hypothetical protein [Methylobacterium sp. J-092]MCJ2005719.1 hypothetical protein [Methylobacterium sp. J-092]
MPVTQRQLAASIAMALQIADSEAIAAFLLDPATTLTDHNPLSRTSAGAQRQIWTGRQREFASFGVAALGVPCLLNALQRLPNDEPMIQEMLQAGPCRAYVYHYGDGCRIVGAVLHAKGTASLPVVKLPRWARARPAKRKPSLQLDLFAIL